MHRIIVDEKKWVSDNRFLHAIELLHAAARPGGPAARDPISAGSCTARPAASWPVGLFVVPGITSIMALSYIYAVFREMSGFVTAMFFGLKAAVLAIVLDAGGPRRQAAALKNNIMLGLAAAAFVGIFFFGVPFPIIILGAGIIGFLGGRAAMPQFAVGGGHGAAPRRAGRGEACSARELPAHAKPSVGQSLRVGAIWLVIWLAPGGRPPRACGR